MFVWKPVERSEKGLYFVPKQQHVLQYNFLPFILNATQTQMKITVLCSEVARCLECQSDGYTKN